VDQQRLAALVWGAIQAALLGHQQSAAWQKRGVAAHLAHPRAALPTLLKMPVVVAALSALSVKPPVEGQPSLLVAQVFPSDLGSNQEAAEVVQEEPEVEVEVEVELEEEQAEEQLQEEEEDK